MCAWKAKEMLSHWNPIDGRRADQTFLQGNKKYGHKKYIGPKRDMIRLEICMELFKEERIKYFIEMSFKFQDTISI